MIYRVNSRMWPWRFSLCILVGFAVQGTRFHLDLAGNHFRGVEVVVGDGIGDVDDHPSPADVSQRNVCDSART